MMSRTILLFKEPVYAVGVDCVVIDGVPYMVLASPQEQQPGNLIGRNLLYKLGWGMHLDDQGNVDYDTFDKPMIF